MSLVTGFPAGDDTVCQVASLIPLVFGSQENQVSVSLAQPRSLLTWQDVAREGQSSRWMSLACRRDPFPEPMNWI